MSIDRDQVLHIARLARLRLGDEEVERFQAQLGTILDYADALDAVDTTDVEPTTHAVPLQICVREDLVDERLTHDDVLRNAPDTADGQFRVPKVVEG